jgi:ubiquinone/menaquinone biosynthesis C-methylase UbiE
LTTGTYTGVDRSAKMVAAAVRRNRDAVDAGRARFLEVPFAGVDLPSGGFDVIFAARVVAMFRPPEQALAKRLLRPGGRLVLAHDAPP